MPLPTEEMVTPKKKLNEYFRNWGLEVVDCHVPYAFYAYVVQTWEDSGLKHVQVTGSQGDYIVGSQPIVHFSCTASIWEGADKGRYLSDTGNGSLWKEDPHRNCRWAVESTLKVAHIVKTRKRSR